MSKVILITGSSGFVGTNFIRNAGKLIFKEVDLFSTKVESVDFSGCDCVIHLAALVHQTKKVKKEEYFTVNRDLTIKVAIRAKAQGVRHFIFMSTVKVIGETTSGIKYWDEYTLCKPSGPYGESKFQAELLLQEMEDPNFRVAIIRAPIVYGPGVKANMYNIIKLVDKFPILPLGGIQNKRSMVYVNNLVELIKRIIYKNASGIYIAGDQAPISTTSLVQLIALGLKKKRQLVKTPAIVISLLRFIKPSITDRIWGSLELDNSNSNHKLGFVPPYSTNMGISEMVKWYLQEKQNKKNYI